MSKLLEEWTDSSVHNTTEDYCITESVVQRRLPGQILAPLNCSGARTSPESSNLGKSHLSFYLYFQVHKYTGWMNYTLSCSHFTVRLYLTISCTHVFLYLYSATFCGCKVVCNAVHLASFNLFQWNWYHLILILLELE